MKPLRGTFLGGKTSYAVWVIKIGPPVRRVLVTKRPKIEQKKERTKHDSGKLGIRREHAHRWIKMKFCVVRDLQGGSSKVRLSSKSIKRFQLWGSKFGLPVNLAIGLYNSLYYCSSHDCATSTSVLCSIGLSLV